MRRARAQEPRRPVRRLRWWEQDEQVLSLDPRDQAIVRAKELLRRGER